jgi:hypothetical protein
MFFGRKTEEYIADFHLMCKRSLSRTEWKLFRYAYLLGADWSLIHRQFGLPRTNFIHTCYRIEAKLGKAFRETKPYGLYPLDEYFSGTMRREKLEALHPVPTPFQPVRAPLAA